MPVTSENDVGVALAEIAENLLSEDALRVFGPIADQLSEAAVAETDSLEVARLARLWAPIAKFGVRGDEDGIRGKLSRKLVLSITNTKWDLHNGHQGLDEIAIAISRLTPRVDQKEAAENIADAARSLARLYENADDGSLENSPFYPCRQIVALSALMEPETAAPLLIEMILHYPNDSLASGLAAVFARMDSGDRAGIAEQTTDVLLRRIRSAPDATIRSRFAIVLAKVAGELRSDTAERACAEAARQLIGDIQKVEHGSDGSVEDIARSVVAVTSRLNPPERARFSRDAARGLVAVGMQAWLEFWGSPWREWMTRLTEQMEPADAAQLIEEALRAELTAQTERVRAGVWSIRIESALADCLGLYNDPKASDIAWLLAQLICSDAYATLGGGRPYEHSRFDDILSEPASKTAEEVAGPPPRRCRLTTPQLVELLKMPTCFGAARRVILDHLERRYDRRFNTIWAFVRFAEEAKLGLDFTTPPVRPDPAKMTLSVP